MSSLHGRRSPKARAHYEMDQKLPKMPICYRRDYIGGTVALCLWVVQLSTERDGAAQMRLITDRSLAVVTIMQEAAGETYAGKLAVAEVIRNRMHRKYSSDGTVAGTVLRPLQFSGWNAQDPGRVRNAKLDDDDPIVQECVKAWDEAMAGSDTVKGAVLYYNPDPKLVPVTPDWAMPHSAREIAHIGHHVFFVPVSRRGTGGSSET